MKKILGLLLIGVLLIAVAPSNAVANDVGNDVEYVNSYYIPTDNVVGVVTLVVYNSLTTADVSDAKAVTVGNVNVDIGDKYLEDDYDVGWETANITYNKNLKNENYNLPLVIPLC